MRDEDLYIRLPVNADTNTGRDPQRTCVFCAGRQFRIMSDGPQQAWLRCLECGERQPSKMFEASSANKGS